MRSSRVKRAIGYGTTFIAGRARALRSWQHTPDDVRAQSATIPGCGSSGQPDVADAAQLFSVGNKPRMCMWVEVEVVLIHRYECGPLSGNKECGWPNVVEVAV